MSTGEITILRNPELWNKLQETSADREGFNYPPGSPEKSQLTCMFNTADLGKSKGIWHDAA